MFFSVVLDRASIAGTSWGYRRLNISTLIASGFRSWAGFTTLVPIRRRPYFIVELTPFACDGKVDGGVLFSLMACSSLVCICRTPKFQNGRSQLTRSFTMSRKYAGSLVVNMETLMLLLLLMPMLSFCLAMGSTREEG